MELAAKPVPVTFTVFPTGPLSGVREMLAVDGGASVVAVPVRVVVVGVTVDDVGDTDPPTRPVKGVSDGVTVDDVITDPPTTPVKGVSDGVTVDDVNEATFSEGVTVESAGVTVLSVGDMVDDDGAPGGSTVVDVGVTVLSVGVTITLESEDANTILAEILEARTKRIRYLLECDETFILTP